MFGFHTPNKRKRVLEKLILHSQSFFLQSNSTTYVLRNHPRYVLTDEIVKEYFSELHELLPDFEVCEATKERVPALQGERLQLDSLPPLLICLTKCYKHDIKKDTRPKIRSHFEFPLVRKMSPYPFLLTCFPLTCLFCYSVLISTK